MRGQTLRRALAVVGSGVVMAFSAGAAHSQGDPPAPEQLSKLSFSRSFAGQLAPPLPAECERRALKTSCGNLIDSGEAVWQRGPYSSLWVRLSCSLPAAPCSELRAHVDAALTAQAAMRAPVYVTLPESSLNGEHIECLLRAGFAFHHYRSNVRALHPGVRAACNTFLPHRKPDAVSLYTTHGRRGPAMTPCLRIRPLLKAQVHARSHAWSRAHMHTHTHKHSLAHAAHSCSRTNSIIFTSRMHTPTHARVARTYAQVHSQAQALRITLAPRWFVILSLCSCLGFSYYPSQIFPIRVFFHKEDCCFLQEQSCFHRTSGQCCSSGSMACGSLPLALLTLARASCAQLCSTRLSRVEKAVSIIRFFLPPGT